MQYGRMIGPNDETGVVAVALTVTRRGQRHEGTDPNSG